MENLNYLGMDRDYATGGSNTTIVDATKDMSADVVKDKIVIIEKGDKKYYRKISGNTIDTITIPKLPGTSATCEFGTGTALVTAVADDYGVVGNDYSVVVVLAPGDNTALSASLAGKVITVYLGTDAEGVADDAKNTATLVAGVVNDVPGFSATMTGIDGVVDVHAGRSFTGGIDEVVVELGTKYQIIL